MRIAKTILIATMLAGLFANRAEAIPVLQLDMKGGTYDFATGTIVASGSDFVLYAILTPPIGATANEINGLLNTFYYVSIAIQPAVMSSSALGSFTFEGTTYNATGDLTYGSPPIETIAGFEGHDPGDLPPHGVFPTYFTDVQFKFNPLDTTQPYNTADNPGGPSGVGSGAYYVGFVGDATGLTDGYALHFDLYDEVTRTCTQSGSCTAGDVDVNRFAPFSHDAQTVPEPASGLLMLLAVGFVAAVRRMRSA